MVLTKRVLITYQCWCLYQQHKRCQWIVGQEEIPNSEVTLDCLLSREVRVDKQCNNTLVVTKSNEVNHVHWLLTHHVVRIPRKTVGHWASRVQTTTTHIRLFATLWEAGEVRIPHKDIINTIFLPYFFP